MTAKEKALELLSKINNDKITTEILSKISRGAKNDLKRKVYVVINEVIENLEQLCISNLGTYKNPKIRYWQEVKEEINKL